MAPNLRSAPVTSSPFRRAMMAGPSVTSNVSCWTSPEWPATPSLTELPSSISRGYPLGRFEPSSIQKKSPRHIVGESGIMKGPWRAQGRHHLTLGDRVLVLAHFDLAYESRDRQANTHRPFCQRTTPVRVQQHRVFDVTLEVSNKSREHCEVLLLTQDLWHAIAVRHAEVPRWRPDCSWRIPTR